MDDQHRLLNYYDEVLRYVELHLVANHGAEEIEVKDKINYSGAFRIKKDSQVILLYIPYQFPDVFPKVFIPDPYFTRIYPIPHLDIDHSLCIFDSEEAHPNPENPTGVVDAVIERAFLLIKAGNKRENIGDYPDEFDSYWRQHANGNILSLVEITASVKEVTLIKMDHPNIGQGYLAVDSIADGISWIIQAGGKDLGERRRAIYLPLKSLGIPPFPSTNNAILKQLRANDPDLVKRLHDFLDKVSRPSLVIFSIATTKGHILGAWEHQKPEQIKPNAYLAKRKYQSAMNGFRKGLKNARMELNHFGLVKINKYSVIRIDRERLLTRGGDGTNMYSLRVGIVGCGSIGSHIANSLCDLGINQLVLIDKDVLTFENVARHLCGASYVGKHKVNAVNDFLSSRLPHSKHTAYHGDVLNILRNNETFLNRCELTVVATAHLPTEFRLDELQRCGIIERPIIYVWVEPYLAGAHAVYINPQNRGQFRDLFDENNRFRHSILKMPGQYTIREAGCQSTYVPYSIFEVKRFVYELMSFIHKDIFNGAKKENMIFSWLGNASLQRSSGREINERWNNINDYSVLKTRVTSDTEVV